MGAQIPLLFPSYVTIERPVANFSFDTDRGCIPLEVNFSDASQTYFTEPITARKWSFFEGIPSTSLLVLLKPSSTVLLILLMFN